MSDAGASQLFAWDGVSFRVPGSWHLAGYRTGRKVSRVELEDDYAVRLEAEWTRLAAPVDRDRLRERFLRASKRLVDAATETTELTGVSPARAAFLYTMADDTRLVTAFLPGAADLLCFARLYFRPDDPEQPRETLMLIARSLQAHTGGTVPWAFYDVSVELPAEFRLVSTALEAGRKLLVFQWRLRRLFVWHCSLAGILLKGRAPAEWAAEFLNGFEGVRGPTFLAGPDGTIVARRPWRYALGHFEEIARWCFRYHAQCVHDEPRNRLILWLYQHRQPQDLERLPDKFWS